jgi:methylphosphotriester-DNA--protein-cysteine methyltransferase
MEVLLCCGASKLIYEKTMTPKTRKALLEAQDFSTRTIHRAVERRKNSSPKHWQSLPRAG